MVHPKTMSKFCSITCIALMHALMWCITRVLCHVFDKALCVFPGDQFKILCCPKKCWNAINVGYSTNVTPACRDWSVINELIKRGVSDWHKFNEFSKKMYC